MTAQQRASAPWSTRTGVQEAAPEVVPRAVPEAVQRSRRWSTPAAPSTPLPEVVLAGQPITESDAMGWIPRTCFRTGPPRRVGLELELLLETTEPDAAQVPERSRLDLVEDLRALPLTSRLTVEPGGQVELSGPPATDISQAVSRLADDLAQARRRATCHGLRLVGVGLDPHRPPRRVLDDPRYAAMEAYFDGAGSAGRHMMCSTASVQVNVEAAVRNAGPDCSDEPGVFETRWRLLHDVGPALVAAFANSPLYRGRPSGWASTRQAVWWAIDATRTRAVQPRRGESLQQSWARWCLEAPLLLVRRPAAAAALETTRDATLHTARDATLHTAHDATCDTDPAAWAAPRGVTFRDWIRHASNAVPGRPGPTLDDLAYHLTTLFPPVRARGHLEVRYLDAQPGDAWQVPAAVVSALVDDPRAGDLALDACAATAGRWLDAARRGVADPALRRSAVAVLATAAASLRADRRTRTLGDLVEGHLARYTLRGRCPGDDLRDGVLGGSAS